MLYVQLDKALCGVLRAALFFYRKLWRELEDMGFEVNPYDPCVANKTIDGTQCTICWHVDDLKISHVNPDIVIQVCKDLSDLCDDKVKIHRGGVHDCLGMDMDWESKPGVLIVSMIKYLQKVVEEWPEVLKSTKACPAGDHLFTTRDDKDRELLPPEMASQFHRTAVQLLFLTIRARPDIQTAVSFFTTRVKEPDKDDWGKLRHCPMYLKGTLLTHEATPIRSEPDQPTMYGGLTAPTGYIGTPKYTQGP